MPPSAKVIQCSLLALVRTQNGMEWRFLIEERITKIEKLRNTFLGINICLIFLANVLLFS